MPIKDKYHVGSIDYYDTKDWIMHKHYAKRMPPIQYAFGLMDSNSNILGIVTYSTPVSHTLRELFKPTFSLMELNRLVINEGLEKNCLSFLVSQSLKMLPNPLVIVSYADTEYNHHGYIYQATNFIYTGLSAEFKDYAVSGMDHMHHASVVDIARSHKGKDKTKYLKQKFGDKLYLKERSRKHRYFYFLGSKPEKKQMFSLLKYDIIDYPKGDNTRYDSSYNPTIQKKLF